MVIVGVDIGGTFTDFICINPEEQRVTYHKVSSTPKDPSLAFISGLQELLGDVGKLSRCIHGTTVATNTLIQRAGSRTGLLTTKGFRDVIEMMRGNRPYTDIYNLQWVKPSPLVPRYLRVEVDERVAPDGSEIRPLDEEGVRRAARFFARHGVEAIAVGFLFSYANSSHEKRAVSLLEREFSSGFVSYSADVLAEWREYERMSTTVADAYIKPVMHRYFSSMERELKNLNYHSDLLIMKSNGGVMTSRAARQRPINTFLSGPAAGVVAGKEIGQRAGWSNLITMDMGGTSLDVSVVRQSEMSYTVQGEVEAGIPMRVPMVDVQTIGAGGGSIAWLDPSRLLKVGPQSAGSEPGPVSYGQGGERPTVTDANLILGRLSAGNFLGGKKTLYPDLAERAITVHIGGPLGLTPTAAGQGILRITVANITQQIRAVSTEVGLDPREFALVAFGGAGPLHAIAVARELGIRTVIIPPHPGIVSAMGLLLADMRFDDVRSFPCVLEEEAADKVPSILKQMLSEGVAQLRTEGFEGMPTCLASVDMRYANESYEITVPVNPENFDRSGQARRFDQQHERLYGFSHTDSAHEIISVRTTVIGNTSYSDLLFELGARTQAAVLKSSSRPASRKVFEDVEGGFISMAVHSRDSLPTDLKLEGPVIVEEMDSTTYVPLGWEARVDKWGNLILRPTNG